MQKSSGDDHSGEKVDDQTQRQRDRETRDDACPRCLSEHKQNAADNDGGKVRVADRLPRPVEACLKSAVEIAACPHLFFDSLEDQDIAVYCGTNRNQKPGDGGKRKGDGYEFEYGKVEQ